VTLAGRDRGERLAERGGAVLVDGQSDAGVRPVLAGRLGQPLIQPGVGECLGTFYPVGAGRRTRARQRLT